MNRLQGVKFPYSVYSPSGRSGPADFSERVNRYLISQPDEGNFTEGRTDCKPRANNWLIGAEIVAALGWC